MEPIHDRILPCNQLDSQQALAEGISAGMCVIELQQILGHCHHESGSGVVFPIGKRVLNTSVSGLVVKSIVAIDGPRVRFAADASLLLLPGCLPLFGEGR